MYRDVIFCPVCHIEKVIGWEKYCKGVGIIPVGMLL